MQNPVENNTMLQKLSVSFTDPYGGFAPGVPGDFVQLHSSTVSIPPQQIGTNGTADFSIQLSIPAEQLRSKMSASTQRSVHEVDVRLYHAEADAPPPGEGQELTPAEEEMAR